MDNSGPEPAMFSEKQIGVLLHLHPNTVKKLYREMKMPQPIWLGGRKRWPKQQILKWIADGCGQMQVSDLTEGSDE